MIELAHMDALRIGGRWMGGSQAWYRRFWHRQSGCGPTNAALLVWYLARTRSEYAGLCDTGARSKDDFLRVMDAMFRCVTPGFRGVHSPAKFIRGVEAYAEVRGTDLSLTVLEPEQIAPALQKDLPVAFLNLHSGNQRQLTHWHWMTIVACEPGTMRARCCDGGRVLEFSLREWQATSRLGGSFVTLNQQ